MTPQYLYGNTELPSPSDGALFHYTKFDSFLTIIDTMTLRSSPLYKMNDLNETNINSLDWINDFNLYNKANKYIKDSCSVISFTKNVNCQEGSDHPAMWAHYGDNSNGVCIVIDENRLLENNKELLSKHFYKLEKVRYSRVCSPNGYSLTAKKYPDESVFIQKNYKELFYKKHSDWSYEKEVRFFIEQPEVFLNIKGAIKHIVLGGKLRHDKEQLKRLITEMITPHKQSYHYFNITSFAEISTSPYGYVTNSAAYTMMQAIREMAESNPLAKSYLHWHNVTYKTSI